MAIVYGRPGAELQLLRGCPQGINCLSDIKIQFEKSQKQLSTEKKQFYKVLPDRIQNEKSKLENLKIIRIDVEKKWDEKISNIQKSFENNKWKFWIYIDLVIKRNFSKPREIRNANENIQRQMGVIKTLEVDPEGVFSKEKNGLISYVDRLDGLTKSPEYWGAVGEINVLQELRKLDDRYHVLCDVNIQLKKYVSYNGQWNLRSAQMDFVVVGPTGIYVLEVKNWGSDQVNHHRGLNPHEQVDRAGRVLWIYLKQHSFFYKPRVTNLLVPVQGNIEYNQYYRSVSLSEKSNFLM
ncbi:MAG TPA: NERD domain-containing protein [Candidatus Thermoplasmatota archaeon]|nr:NERD domain-containing protein [Candidatus Thermoplasmatota archaeon]